jgi:putative addiction module component (TIGR02574 family)
MNERVKKLTEEIRKLSPEDRADLMDELLVLTYREPDPEIEKAWLEEIDRRLDSLERGEAKTIPLEEAIARLRPRYPRAQ